MRRHHLLRNPAVGATRFSPPTHGNRGTHHQRSPTLPHPRPHRHVQSASPRPCSPTKYVGAEQIPFCARNPRREGSTSAPNTKLQAGAQTTPGTSPQPPASVAALHLNLKKRGAGTCSCSFLFGLVSRDLQKCPVLRQTLRISKAENLQQLKCSRTFPKASALPVLGDVRTPE